MPSSRIWEQSLRVRQPRDLAKPQVTLLFLSCVPNGTRTRLPEWDTTAGGMIRCCVVLFCFVFRHSMCHSNMLWIYERLQFEHRSRRTTCQLRKERRVPRKERRHSVECRTLLRQKSLFYRGHSQWMSDFQDFLPSYRQWKCPQKMSTPQLMSSN